jgi:hypothetical protein
MPISLSLSSPILVGDRNNRAPRSLLARDFDEQTKRRRAAFSPKRPKDKMKNQSHHKPLKAIPASGMKSGHRKPAEAWRPKATSLTREEVRELVMEMIG